MQHEGVIELWKTSLVDIVFGHQDEMLMYILKLLI